MLKSLCNDYSLGFIDNGNIRRNHLNSSGLHLNMQGTAALANNFLDYIDAWLGNSVHNHIDYKCVSSKSRIIIPNSHSTERILDLNVNNCIDLPIEICDKSENSISRQHFLDPNVSRNVANTNSFSSFEANIDESEIRDSVLAYATAA